MRRHGDDDDSMFPQVVAWLGLAAALLLFFGNTVPAVRERKELSATAADLRELRRQYDVAIQHAQAGTPGCAGEQDLQSVLVAIDRIGWTPAELLACYPEPASSEPSAPPPRGD